MVELHRNGRVAWLSLLALRYKQELVFQYRSYGTEHSHRGLKYAGEADSNHDRPVVA